MPSRIEQLRSESQFVSPYGLHQSRTIDSERTAVGDTKVHLYLKPGTELPTVPYKLRFAVRSPRINVPIMLTMYSI